MTTVRKGGQLPAVALVTPDGARVPLRGHRGPLIVYVVHSAECDACIDYARTLADARERFAEWDATVRIVAPADDRALRRAAGDVRVLLDSEGVLVRPSEEAAATLIVADEWGEIYHIEDATDPASLPSPDEVVEWVRFIAIQCPECEGPEGEWRTI